MNSTIFIEYMNELFASCQQKDPEKKFVFILDNAKYHRCEEGDPGNQGPNRKSLSQMNKDELISRLLRRGCPETKESLTKKLKPVLYEMAQQDEYQGRLDVEVAAEKFGYNILWLPPYHPELNPIEEAWGLTKQHVALENDGSDFKKVKALILDGFAKANEAWPKLVRRTKQNEEKYRRIILAQQIVDKLEPIIIDVSDSEDEAEDGEEDLIDLDELGDGLAPVENDEITNFLAQVPDYFEDPSRYRVRNYALGLDN